MIRPALRIALANNYWLVLLYVLVCVALPFSVNDDSVWRFIVFLSLGLATNIWLAYRDELAKTRDEQTRKAMWWRDRWIATILVVAGGIPLLFFLG